MLVNCPRCGFSQPNDQYCAQCGVDMHSFKQKKQPLFKQLLSKAVVQIAILLMAAFFVGQNIFRLQEPQNWVQKITHFRGMSTSKKTNSLASPGSAEEFQAEKNAARASGLPLPPPVSLPPVSLKNQENSAGQTSEPGTNSALAASSLASADTQGDARNLGSVSFKLTYAEISMENLAKLVADSTNLGLYQILTTYSAGIINDFSKHAGNFKQILKRTDLKLSPGATNSNLSGTMSPDGSQILGLVTSIDYKSNENDIIHGNINVTNASSQNNELYPAEFNLPKGSAFFIIGALKRESFNEDRAKLTMPPFQVFKSADFMTRKTEFVIIVEPLYN